MNSQICVSLKIVSIETLQLKGFVNFALDKQNKEFIFIYGAEYNFKIKNTVIKETYEGKVYCINMEQLKSHKLNKVVAAIYNSWLNGEIKELYFDKQEP
ncbi:hypothetical protein FFX44_00520 [Lactobacillus sp. UCMA15818]|nr:hypothetical protein [Lactobacillus sp. UCMA15818]